MLEPNTQDDEANTLKQWVEQGAWQPAVLAWLLCWTEHACAVAPCLDPLVVKRVQQGLTNML